MADDPSVKPTPAQSQWPCGCVYGIFDQKKVLSCATHAIGPLACCPRAKALQCVCAYAYECPVHGTRHMGTHD